MINHLFAQNLCLTTPKERNKTNTLLPAEFEPATQEIDRPQINALDRAAAGTGNPFINEVDLLKISYVK
jgi:hypothetical protein